MSFPVTLVRWLFLQQLSLYNRTMDQMSYGKCFAKHDISGNSADDSEKIENGSASHQSNSKCDSIYCICLFNKTNPSVFTV